MAGLARGLSGSGLVLATQVEAPVCDVTRPPLALPRVARPAAQSR